jgi:hypothetical protein
VTPDLREQLEAATIADANDARQYLRQSQDFPTSIS